MTSVPQEVVFVKSRTVIFFVSIEEDRQQEIRQRRQAPRVLSFPEYWGTQYNERLPEFSSCPLCGSFV
jgi:hypothetical protein